MDPTIFPNELWGSIGSSLDANSCISLAHKVELSSKNTSPIARSFLRGRTFSLPITPKGETRFSFGNSRENLIRMLCFLNADCTVATLVSDTIPLISRHLPTFRIKVDSVIHSSTDKIKMSTIFAKLFEVKELNLDIRQFNEINSIIHDIELLPLVPSLKKLTLKYSGLILGIDQQDELFTKLLSRFPQLENLSITFNDRMVPIDKAVAFIIAKNLTHLKKLHVSNALFDDESVSAILMNCIGIEELAFEKTTGIQNLIAESEKYPSIRNIRLSDTAISNTLVTNILLGCFPNVQTVQFPGCKDIDLESKLISINEEKLFPKNLSSLGIGFPKERSIALVKSLPSLNILLGYKAAALLARSLFDTTRVDPELDQYIIPYLTQNAELKREYEVDCMLRFLELPNAKFDCLQAMHLIDTYPNTFRIRPIKERFIKEVIAQKRTKLYPKAVLYLQFQVQDYPKTVSANEAFVKYVEHILNSKYPEELLRLFDWRQIQRILAPIGSGRLVRNIEMMKLTQKFSEIKL